MAPPGTSQTNLLDILKKKMRQAREEADAAQDESGELRGQLEEEKKRREEVNYSHSSSSTLVQIMCCISVLVVPPLNTEQNHMILTNRS